MSTRFVKYLASIAGIALGSLALAFAAQSPAKAQAAYGSYIGIGPAFGDGEIAVAINGRYNILELPISIRGAAFLGDGTSFVLQPGVDYTLDRSNLVIYGNAIVPIGGDTSTAVQGGVGIQF